MTTEVLVAIIAAGALVISQIVQSILSRARAKSDLEGDVELYASLPKESTARGDLLKDIDRRISNRIKEQAHTRYWFGIVFSLFLLAVAGWFVYQFVITPDWWKWLFIVFAGTLALFGLVGLTTYTPKRERGANGVEIKRTKTPSKAKPSSS